MINHDELLEIFSYEDGKLIYRYTNHNGSRTQGRVAGSLNKAGYRIIKLNNRDYLAHRLIWFYCNGMWPSKDIDHINRCKDDNRIENLREVTKSENAQNRVVRGYRWNKKMQLWMAYIRIDGKLICSLHKTEQEAIYARQQMKQKYHVISPTI